MQKYSCLKPDSKYLIAQYPYFWQWWCACWYAVRVDWCFDCMSVPYHHSSRDLYHTSKPTTPMWIMHMRFAQQVVALMEQREIETWRRSIRKHLSTYVGSEGHPLSITARKPRTVDIHELTNFPGSCTHSPLQRNSQLAVKLHIQT